MSQALERGRWRGHRPRQANYGLRLRNGPAPMGKFDVFKTWIPALCSPLKGVTVAGQPLFCASWCESNQRPKWYVCTGLVVGFVAASGNGGSLNTSGAGAGPWAKINVSILKRPLKCWTASPL